MHLFINKNFERRNSISGVFKFPEKKKRKKEISHIFQKLRIICKVASREFLKITRKGWMTITDESGPLGKKLFLICQTFTKDM